MSIATDRPTAQQPTAGRPAQPDDARRRNVSAIMRTVLKHAPLARAEVAKITGLAPGSVTKMTARMVEVGLLREETAQPVAGMPGRPRVPLSVDPRYRVIGVHIGLLWSIIGVLDLAGRVVDEITVRHGRRTSFEAVLEAVVDQVRRVTDGPDGRNVLGVGASAGGWVDPDSGVVVEHPALRWREAPLREAIARRVRRPVLVDSTVRAMALAESWLGESADVRSLLHVFVGNIVGAGFVFEGRLLRGPGSAAGNIDHLPVGVRSDRTCRCGRHDCLQVVASDVAVVAEAQRRGLLESDQELSDLAANAHAGDSRAARMLRTRARHVGHATGLLVELLNPERVIVGGGVSDYPEYLPDLRAAMGERLTRTPHTDLEDLVRPTSFGRQAVMLASAALFLDAFYLDPMAFPPLATRAS